MRTAHKLASLLILIAGVAIPALAQQSTELVGSYLFRFEWGGTRLTLKHDGTFIKESSDCTGVTTAAGPYFCQNGLCEFTTKKLYRVQVSGDVKVGDQLSTRVSDVRQYARAVRASSYLESLVD